MDDWQSWRTRLNDALIERMHTGGEQHSEGFVPFDDYSRGYSPHVTSDDRNQYLKEEYSALESNTHKRTDLPTGDFINYGIPRVNNHKYKNDVKYYRADDRLDDFYPDRRDFTDTPEFYRGDFPPELDDSYSGNQEQSRDTAVLDRKKGKDKSKDKVMPHRRERRMKQVEVVPHGKDHVLERKIIYSEGSEGSRGHRSHSPQKYDRYHERYDYEPHAREVIYERGHRERSPRRKVVHHVVNGYARPAPAPVPVPVPPPPMPPRRVEYPVPYPVPVPVYRSQWQGGDVYRGAAMMGPQFMQQPQIPPPGQQNGFYGF